MRLATTDECLHIEALKPYLSELLAELVNDLIDSNEELMTHWCQGRTQAIRQLIMDPDRALALTINQGENDARRAS